MGSRLLLVVEGRVVSLEPQPELLDQVEGTMGKPPHSIASDDTDGGVLLDVLERPYLSGGLVRRTLWRLPE